MPLQPHQSSKPHKKIKPHQIRCGEEKEKCGNGEDVLIFSFLGWRFYGTEKMG